MLATRVFKLPEGPEWEYEVKWDGYRIQARKIGSEVCLFSRRGADYSRKFKTVADAVRSIRARDAILDGEVVAIDPQGQPSFQILQNRGKLSSGYRLVFYAFDLLCLNGRDLKHKPLSQRRATLTEILADSRLLFSAPLKGTPAVLMDAVRKHNLEGILAKRKDSIYEPGRRRLAWQKLPLKLKQEFVIGGYRPEGETLELILVGYYDDKKFLFAGKVRQGLNPPLRKKLLKLLKPLTVSDCLFENLPTSRRGHWGEGITAEDMKEYTWIEPRIVAEIKFTEWTTGQVLRHAEFLGLRDDKEAREVSRES